MDNPKLPPAVQLASCQQNNSLFKETVAAFTAAEQAKQNWAKGAAALKGQIYLAELEDNNSSSEDEEERMLNSQGLGFTNLLFSYDQFQQGGHGLAQRNMNVPVPNASAVGFPRPGPSNLPQNRPPDRENTSVANGKDLPAMPKPYNCPECDDAFSHLNFLKEHMLTAHRPLPCDGCGPNGTKPDNGQKKRSPTQGGFVISAEIVRPKGHPCPECGKTFLWPKRLERHMVMHSNVRPFQCKLCPGTFKHIEHLQKHVKRVHKQDPVTGTAAAVAFPSQHAVNNKPSSSSCSQPNPNKKHLCPECNKGFDSNYKVRRHMATHTKERLFTCPICGAGLKNNEGLKKHMATHSLNFPVSTGTGSDASGANRNNIPTSTANRNGTAGPIANIVANLSNPPFFCPGCGSHFENAASLQQHCVVAHGFNPQAPGDTKLTEGLYQCETCGKSFARKENRRIHETLHTGILPFVCATCHRGFATNYRLKRHMKTHGAPA